MPPGREDPLSRFVLATAGAALCMTVLWAGFHPRTELADKLYFGAAALPAFVALVAPVPSPPGRWVTRLGVLGCVLLFCGLLPAERINSANVYWSGFRPQVALLALALAPFMGRLLAPELLRSARRRALGVLLLVVICGLGVLSFVQSPTSLRLVSHAAFVLNEIYAVAAGHYPYTDFIPQYQVLLSYLFAPLIAWLGAEAALSPILYCLSGLALLTAALGVVAGVRATRGLNPIVAPLLILPLVFAGHGAALREVFALPAPTTRWADSIASLHSAYPIRLLGPTVVGVMLIALPVLGQRSWARLRHSGALGFVLGLAAFHQVDFGIASALSAAAIISLGLPRKQLLHHAVPLGLGIAVGATCVPLLHSAAGHPLRLGTLGWFLRQFGSGFGSVPMRIPGPVLVVLPLLLGATVTCVRALWTHRQSAALAEAPEPTGADATPVAPVDVASQYHAALVGAYFGMFALAAFPYYINRSYASGQLQIFLMPLGIALSGAASVVVGSAGWQRARRQVLSLPFRLALAVPVASVLLLPHPLRELGRLRSEAPGARWPGERTRAILSADLDKLGDRASVGYFGMDGNFVEAASGLRNLSRFSSPMDAKMSPAAIEELCAGLAQTPVRAILLGEQALDLSLCPGKWTMWRSRSGLPFAVPDEPPAQAVLQPPGSPPHVESSVLSVQGAVRAAAPED